MFRGEYPHSLDAKGRIVLPQRLRDGLGERFVITRGLMAKCLFVFTIEDWAAFDEKAKRYSISDVKAQTFLRYFMGGAYDADCDGQGRTLIPAYLREHAGIVKDIVSLGVTNRVEIWAKEEHSVYSTAYSSIDSEIADYMTAMNF